MSNEGRRKKIGELLKDAGALDESGLNMALAEQARWGGPLGRILVDMRLVEEDVLVQVLSRQLGVPAVDLKKKVIPQEAFDVVPVALAQHYTIIPLRDDGRTLDVAMADPQNATAIEEIRSRTQRSVRVHLAGARAIKDAIARYYRGSAPDTMELEPDTGTPPGGRTEPVPARRVSAAKRDPMALFADPTPGAAAAPPRPTNLAPLTPQPQEARPVTPPDGAPKKRRTLPPLMPGKGGMSRTPVGPSPLAGPGPASPPVASPVPSPGLTEEAARQRSTTPPPVTAEGEELRQLRSRISKLEALLARDEEVIRKLIAFLVRKSLCTREEITDWLSK